MKVTVITDDKGEYVGAILGECESAEIHGQMGLSCTDETNPDIRAGVLLGPGQRTREIQVSDELANLDADEFAKKIKIHLTK